MLGRQVIQKHNVAVYIPLEAATVFIDRRQTIHFSVRVMLRSPEAGFSSRLSLNRIQCALPPARGGFVNAQPLPSIPHEATGMLRPDEGYS